MKNPIDISTHRARMELLISTALARRGDSRSVVVAFLLSHQVTADTFLTDPAKTIVKVLDYSIRRVLAVKADVAALEKALPRHVIECVREFMSKTKREATQRAISFCRTIDGEGVRT